MRQFIETSDGDLINIDNVSNIVFDPDWTDRFGNHKPKIIFNFAYPVSLPKSDKKISDYKYDIFKSVEEYKAAEKDLEKLINEKNWIAPVINKKIQKIINPDKISFMTSDDNNQRIILNLSTSVSFHGDYHRMTSDFVYLNHYDWEEYQNNLSYIRGLLKLKEM
jgi:hypothetical protein